MQQPVELDEVLARLRDHEPEVAGSTLGWRAATAMILHDHDRHGPEALFIERSQRRGDRWSGQMALPGGRHEDSDEDLAATAIREAREEVGVVLGSPVARLDDVHGRTITNAVSTFVFTVPRRPELELSAREVSAAIWIPVATFFDPGAAVRYRYLAFGSFPAIEYRGHVVWGLTYRILEHFADVLGRQLAMP